MPTDNVRGSTANALATYLRDIVPGDENERLVLDAAAERLDEYARVVWPINTLKAPSASARVSSEGTSERGTEKTGWKCERCGNCGSIRYAKSTGVYDVLTMLETEHANEARGDCAYDLAKMRVWPIPSLPALDGRE